jgi:hypothetical protein
MDRGALIGGAAVLAALAGVVGFYFVLSSGSTGSLPEYDREKPAVEQLEARKSGGAMMRNAAGDEAPEKGEKGEPVRTADSPQASTKNDPARAEMWRQKRLESLQMERERATQQLDAFAAAQRLEEDEHKALRQVFEDNLETRVSIKTRIEEGEISPRVGRELLAEQREGMKAQLLDQVTPEQYEDLRTRMDKARVVLF